MWKNCALLIISGIFSLNNKTWAESITIPIDHRLSNPTELTDYLGSDQFVKARKFMHINHLGLKLYRSILAYIQENNAHLLILENGVFHTITLKLGNDLKHLENYDLLVKDILSLEEKPENWNVFLSAYDSQAALLFKIDNCIV